VETFPAEILGIPMNEGSHWGGVGGGEGSGSGGRSSQQGSKCNGFEQQRLGKSEKQKR
jgi:hypothetical protein